MGIKIKECYGKRLENWDKCNKCDEIEECSVMTLEIIFGNKVVIIV